MHHLAHRIELAQLQTLQIRDVGGYHFSRLTSTLDCQDEIDPYPVAKFMQRVLDQFAELSEFARTDFFSSLIAFSQKCPSADDSLRLEDLEPSLKLLEVWDLELALELFGCFPCIGVLKTIHGYCQHEELIIREAALRAMNRVLPPDPEFAEAI